MQTTKDGVLTNNLRVIHDTASGRYAVKLTNEESMLVNQAKNNQLAELYSYAYDRDNNLDTLNKTLFSERRMLL